MRVINSSVGLDYLFEYNFNMSLHGHKHVQYFKFENALDSINKEVLIASSPSLLESNYDKVKGDSIPANRIGYNIIIPTRWQVDLVQLELKDWKYKLTRVGSV